MKSRIYILFCSIVICAIFLVVAWLLSRENFDSVPSIGGEDKCEYILHRTEQVPREDITSFIVDNGKIYIYYDETALVNVYDTAGSFAYGIQISTIKNGHGDIAVLDGKLYIDSRMPVIFIFQDDQITECVDPYSSFEKYISIREVFSWEKSTDDRGNIYQLSRSKNDIIRQNTQETVIDLPQRSYMAEQLLVVGLFVIFLSVYGYDKVFHK